jgi:Bifunctional DNA primase/polymerase, N-terminal/AAA domain
MNQLEQALQYAHRGWRVIPIRPGEKHPPIPRWQEAATTLEETIVTWWTGPYTNHGIGIATGPASGIFVLDIDDKEGNRGYDTLNDLETQHGPLPETLTVITGSGGNHLYFTYPPNQTIRNDHGRRLGSGLDIRGEGGQVVAPGSTHPNGTTYEFDADTEHLEPQPAPQWLLTLLQDPEPPTPPTNTTNSTQDNTSGPAARYNNQTNWTQLLTDDGWTLGHTDRTGEQHWVRPGKDTKDGTSATVGYEGQDFLRVFTSSIPWLPEAAYSRFGYYAQRQHGGDRSAAARHLYTIENKAIETSLHNFQPAHPQPPEPEPEDRLELAHLINWDRFWSTDKTDEEWLAWPLIPRGRAIALYAPAKAGKSTVLLAVVAALAAGQPILGGYTAPPCRCLYIDLEMTEADLHERLTELGYGPETDLTNLHYALLPSLPPMDTIEGAKALLDLVHHTQAEFVAIDTFGRAVQGDEDKADTVRAFYRHTGLALKAAGITYLRTDHSGKDTTKGQRGSSAKNDDVDLVWSLARINDGITLTRTHSRISWVPPEVKIRRHENEITEYLLDLQAETFADGTATRAKLLDELGLTTDTGFNETGRAIRAAGHKMAANHIRDAIRFRKNAAQQREQLRRKHTVENMNRRADTPDRHTPEPDQSARCTETIGAVGAVTKTQVTESARSDEEIGTLGAVIPARRRSKGAARYGDHQNQNETDQEQTPSQPQEEWIF